MHEVVGDGVFEVLTQLYNCLDVLFLHTNSSIASTYVPACFISGHLWEKLSLPRSSKLCTVHTNINSSLKRFFRRKFILPLSIKVSIISLGYARIIRSNLLVDEATSNATGENSLCLLQPHDMVCLRRCSRSC